MAHFGRNTFFRFPTVASRRESSARKRFGFDAPSYEDMRYSSSWPARPVNRGDCSGEMPVEAPRLSVLT